VTPMRADSLGAAAREVGVSPATLRRWVAQDLIPQFDGRWSRTAVAAARVVARLRARGHPVDEIRAATQTGLLAFAAVEALLPSRTPTHTLAQAAAETGLAPDLIERAYTSLGFSPGSLDLMTDDDVELLHGLAAVLAAGLPFVAFLQLLRVYGQALAQIADAEVRLFHLYVHEPMIRDAVPGPEMADEMHALARDLLPHAGPLMNGLHWRYLARFMEQDVIGHMEAEPQAERPRLGRLRVAIAFADLAGYTRITEEWGEEEALDAVERFVEAVENTLPDDARVVKTIGDEVMVIGSDPAALVDWAVGFQLLMVERPRPRIGLHAGVALYRDGDYYGREVNIAARVVARAAGGEVLVTRPVVATAGGNLEFEAIGEVRLKGFRDPTELFLARQADD